MQFETRQEPWGVLSQVSLKWRSFFIGISLCSLTFPNPLRAQGMLTNHVRFRTPHEARYRIEGNALQDGTATNRADWLRAWPEDGSTNFIELGARVVLQLNSDTELKQAVYGRPLKIARRMGAGIFVLEAPDVLTAAHEADRLAGLPEVLTSYPVTRRLADLLGPYASLPTEVNF